jgi:hypothetical protein
VTSQPISILLPFWFFYFIIFIRKSKLKDIQLFISVIVLLQIFFIMTNYYYYTSSSVFLFHYAPKTSDFFALGDKVLALGHYYFQIFFPYLLSFKYSLGDITVIFGLGFLVLFYYLIYKINLLSNFKFFLRLPAAFTFIIFLSTPRHLFDTYLLFPALSVLCLIIYLLPDLKSDLFKSIAFCTIITWCFYSHIQTKDWLSNVSLTKSSFDRRPSCKSALNYSRMSYEAFQSPSADVKKIYDNT